MREVAVRGAWFLGGFGDVMFFRSGRILWCHLTI